MAEDVSNLILEHLRTMRTDLAALVEHAGRVEQRLGALEGHIASLRKDIALLHEDFAGLSVRHDKLAGRVGRIERRLEIRHYLKRHEISSKPLKFMNTKAVSNNV